MARYSAQEQDFGESMTTGKLTGRNFFPGPVDCQSQRSRLHK